MIGWIYATVPYLKALHIVALCIWSAGLLAMPLMLARSAPGDVPTEKRWVRPALHFTYTMLVTPAAVTAVIAGTWLIFLRETYVPWLYAKLFFVMLLVFGHIWIGHVLSQEESEVPSDAGGHLKPLTSFVAATLISLPMIAILLLVLWKPSLGTTAFPEWLLSPRGGQLLLFEVPRP